MNYLTIIIIAGIGIVLGYWLARRSRARKCDETSAPNKTNVMMRKRKEERKQKILKFLQANNRATNNDIEKLLGVSDATATNYLQELEDEGKVKQIGKTGKAVFYTLSNG